MICVVPEYDLVVAITAKLVNKAKLSTDLVYDYIIPAFKSQDADCSSVEATDGVEAMR